MLEILKQVIVLNILLAFFFANNKCLCLNNYNNQNSIKITLCPFIVINLTDLIMETLS